MKSLVEIEAAADALPPSEKEELFLFLAMRLRGDSPEGLPPRDIPKERLAEWIAEDEEGYRHFRDKE